jgi:NAD(P)H dehydrogenase (quinone)
MQVLVMFYSKTGNTERLAQAVVRGVDAVAGVTCVVKAAEDVTREDFLAADGVVAGSPVYYGSMAWPLKRLFDEFVGTRRQMGNKVGAAFVTSGHHTGGKETTLLSILQAFLIYGMVVVGDPLEASGHYGAACSGSPGDVAQEDAFKLGQRVAKLVKKLK